MAYATGAWKDKWWESSVLHFPDSLVVCSLFDVFMCPITYRISGLGVKGLNTFTSKMPAQTCYRYPRNHQEQHQVWRHLAWWTRRHTSSHLSGVGGFVQWSHCGKHLSWIGWWNPWLVMLVGSGMPKPPSLQGKASSFLFRVGLPLRMGRKESAVSTLQMQRKRSSTERNSTGIPQCSLQTCV